MHTMLRTHENTTSFPPLYHNLIPKPHPLMRRNSLVNQVELLGLAASVQTLHAKLTQKGTDT